ncbi:MAG: glycosyltransferase family 4 protein [Bacteroidales bacterium]|nr:glycosyltransferase family 4 protein [Bacteroidales bacterium]
MKVDLVSNWGFKSNNIVVIKNPVFITEEVDINRAEVATNKLLFVGRLADQKGLYYLFKALEILHSKNIDFSIDLIGEGVLKQPLQQFALNSGFANKVNFWGYKNETKSFYENSKVTILSSIYEGFPNVILESLANGVPVVSFKTPFGPEELIVDGVNGYLANYLDVNDLAKMIEKCLLTNWKREKVIQTVADYAADKVLCKYRELLLKM